MKYTVTFSCGHKFEVNIFGKAADRERKIEYLENYCICPECKAAEAAAKMAETCDIQEMLYRDYKQNFDGCKTVPGSYDRKTKMIKVYVPREAS